MGSRGLEGSQHGAFHTASVEARVLLGVLALHMLTAAAGYAVVTLLDALGPRHHR